MNKVCYTDDLIKILEKHRGKCICVGKKGDFPHREDRQITTMFLREDDTVVIEIDDFSTNGCLKYFN